MEKFFGKVGFYVDSVEIRPGVFDDSTIVEREYYGDMVRNSAKIQSVNIVNENVDLLEDISIVADPFALNNFYDIRYVEYLGKKWKVSSVKPAFPRLILTTGGLYNE